MKNLTMQQYLTQVKTIVDNIAASGSKIDPEDIILYILNGLPASYNSFKTFIRSSPLPADLDSLYSLLCSEEIHVNQELLKEPAIDPSALYATSYNQYRGRSQRRPPKNTKNQSSNQTSQPLNSSPASNNDNNRPTCQICGKIGHLAINCWHRCNFKYAPTTTSPQRAMLAQPAGPMTQDWVLDTGASTHLTPDNSNIQHPQNYYGTDAVSVANGSSMPIHHSGQGLLPLPDTPRKLRLCNLLHVPSLTHNLLYVSKLTDDNSISITFDANGFEMNDSQDHRLLLRGRFLNGLYHISTRTAGHHEALITNVSTSLLWHARLGHPNNRILASLANNVPTIHMPYKNFSCTSCIVAKSHKLQFNKRNSISSSLFDLIHTDVWGPALIISTAGFHYYVIFLDDCTRFTWIYFMHTKQETLSKFKILCNLIKTQFGRVPKQLQSNGGGEFTSIQFKTFLQEQGIQQRLSCPHTPEQNGTSERKHRHILELTRTLFHSSNMPANFWPEVISTATYLINRLPSTT
ncbi:Retrovirus-related Pol polyprotein from transposon TNT 1-94 [Dendrobium catenatum]|uniref:Retrovirus-related Pol polyprotein from transposon TNT 1-94 n=1 Tax=Dendrobium catenatum TaxID=906689 RepID=A0A2I0XG28_9ASPA|nr:Retrovirus-related Pol polyprotein from transposon TNT 1-94 [Dendrobium catenatum]